MQFITGDEFLVTNKRNSPSETWVHHEGTPPHSVASVESFHGNQMMVETFNKLLKLSTNC